MAIELAKITSLNLFSAFYGIAGIMHFILPSIYVQVIPEEIGSPSLLNYAAGIAEIAVAVMVLFYKTRKIGGYITIAMLLAFITSHIYFIQMGSCINDICLPEWVGWFRLIVIHPLLIYWAWKVSRLDITVE
jgi:uncharacterized membrane protein